MLRELLRREMGSLKSTDLTKDELESIAEEVSQTVAWCSTNPVPKACLELHKALEKAFKGLARARFIKFLSEQSEKSLDSKLFKTADSLLIRYYKFLMSGLTTSDFEVPVLLNKDMVVKGKVRSRGVIVFLKLLEALLMEALDLAEILVPAT